MRAWRFWLAVFGIELVLTAIGLYLDRTDASLGDGILIGLTQLPGSYLSGALLWENATAVWYYVMTILFQTALFGTVLHVVQFVRSKFTNATNARPEPK